MQIQNTAAPKPLANGAPAKSSIPTQQQKPDLRAVKKEKYLHLSFAELQQSIQRKKNRRTVLEAKLKVLNEKIELREKRLKEISTKQ